MRAVAVSGRRGPAGHAGPGRRHGRDAYRTARSQGLPGRAGAGGAQSELPEPADLGPAHAEVSAQAPERWRLVLVAVLVPVMTWLWRLETGESDGPC